jgi:hypothetical protein
MSLLERPIDIKNNSADVAWRDCHWSPDKSSPSIDRSCASARKPRKRVVRGRENRYRVKADEREITRRPGRRRPGGRIRKKTHPGTRADPFPADRGHGLASSAVGARGGAGEAQGPGASVARTMSTR